MQLQEVVEKNGDDSGQFIIFMYLIFFVERTFYATAWCRTQQQKLRISSTEDLTTGWRTPSPTQVVQGVGGVKINALLGLIMQAPK